MRSSFCLSIACLFVLFGCAPPEGSDAVFAASRVALDNRPIEAELIQNGGFEEMIQSRGYEDPAHWDRSRGCISYPVYDGPYDRHPHTGYNYILIGAEDSQCFGTLSQSVSIPTNAVSADLSFWLNIDGAESNSYFDVYAMRENGQQISEFYLDDRSCRNSDDSCRYTYKERNPFSLLQFRGETIDLKFIGGGFSDRPIWWRLDDVSVKVRYSDFSLSTASEWEFATAGSPATYEITPTADTEGAWQNVAFSVVDLPAGATATFSPGSVKTGSSSILSVDPGGAAPGLYSFKIKGVGDTYGTHGVTVQITIYTQTTIGDFETGTLSGWTATGSVNAGNSDSHTGAYNARIGKGNAPTGLHTLSREISVPTTGLTLLGLWAYFHAPAPQDGDFQRARIRSSSGQLLSTIFKKLGNNSQTWTSFWADLTPYQGTTVVLEFEVQATQVGAAATYMRVDDVSISNF